MNSQNRRNLAFIVSAVIWASACSGDPEIYYPPGYNPGGTPVADGGTIGTPDPTTDTGSDVVADTEFDADPAADVEPDADPAADVEPDAVADPVNGWNADMVLYEGGAFAQLNSTTWVENNATESVLYEEVNRDEWTVYLLESESRLTVNLDLYDGQIYGQDSTSLHEVTGTAYDPADAFATTRFLVTAEELPVTAIVQVGLSNWEGRTPGYAAFPLDESTRDPHTIRLIQSSDGSNAQWSIDFWARTVEVLNSGGEETLEVSLLDAETENRAAPLVREVVYADGRFAQEADYDWYWHLEDEPTRTLQSVSFTEEVITGYYAEEDPEGGEPVGYRIELATVEGRVSVYRDEELLEAHDALEIR